MADIRSAFRQAVASATAGGEVNVNTRTRAADVDEDDDDPGDGAADDDDPDGDSEDAEDEAGETDDDAADEADAGDDDADEGEDETDDDAGDEDAEGDEDEDPEDAEPGKGKVARHALNDEKEFKRVQDKYKNDPEGLRKELLGTFTKKTQELSTERKTYRGLLSYLPLVQAYEADSVQTVKRLARMNGLKVVDDDEATPTAGKGKGKTTAATTDEETAELTDSLMAGFKKDLGADNEYLADQLGPALTKMMQRLADHTVSQRVRPLEEATASTIRGHAELDSDRVMDSFYKAHPDWSDYQDDMDELARTLVGDGDNMRPVPMSEADFLEFLYETVSTKRAAAGHKDRVKTEARRLMKKRLAKLSTARSGERRPAATVPDDKIRRRPKGPVSIRQAFKAAAAGITFDDSGDDDD